MSKSSLKNHLGGGNLRSNTKHKAARENNNNPPASRKSEQMPSYHEKKRILENLDFANIHNSSAICASLPRMENNF